MQRVRNNIHKARKHTQKARKDVRKIRVRMMRDFYEKPLSEDMLEAIREAEQIGEEWEKYWENHNG
ncbi:MAG: hypothetical protein IJM47_05010 [Synergistaceae bacterium]|nr:hypothetical protein [Synergistaceae bacterium]